MARYHKTKHREHPLQLKVGLENLESNLKHELTLSTTGLETKLDRQSSTHAGAQEALSTKLREEIQQLGMNHDAKHREIPTQIKASCSELPLRKSWLVASPPRIDLVSFIFTLERVVGSPP